MGEITVVNKYKEPEHIYCGRGTALGNPFYMKSERERNTVCDKYEDWFYSQVNEVSWLHEDNPNPPTKQLREIYNKALAGDINLGCFCATRRCHCDTIKNFIDNKIEESMK